MKNRINAALQEMSTLIDSQRKELVELNAIDIENCDENDKPLFDRLFIDDNNFLLNALNNKSKYSRIKPANNS